MPEKIYSIEDIKQRIPYGYPMILVDRAWEEEDGKIYGLKNVTVNEEFFNGHFPNHPIMPGVLQVEAAFQLAQFAVSDKLNPNKDLDIYIKSMKRVKFRNPVNPGDRLLISIDFQSIEDNEAKLKFENKSNTGVCTQGELVLSTRPREYEISKPNLFNDFDKKEDLKMDLNELKNYMPHRYPFLFIDYICSVDDTDSNFIAIKNITYNEPMMHSYSPGYSVLPGTIQTEILAQAGCAPILARPENKGKLAFFGAINNAEFYHPIHPGDQLRIELKSSK